MQKLNAARALADEHNTSVAFAARRAELLEELQSLRDRGRLSEAAFCRVLMGVEALCGAAVKAGASLAYADLARAGAVVTK